MNNCKIKKTRKSQSNASQNASDVSLRKIVTPLTNSSTGIDPTKNRRDKKYF